jgi:hypothetical protein
MYACMFQISQTPGGRENAKMFSKSSFSSFSLEHSDRNHFLRPDRILGAFQFHRNKKIEFNKDSAFLLSEEIKFEKNLSEPLGAAELLLEKNLSRVRHAFEDLWRKDPNNMLEENRAGPEQVPRNAFQRGMSLLFRTLTGEAQDDDTDTDNMDTTVGSKPEPSVDEEASLSSSLNTSSFIKGSGGGGGAKYVEMVSTPTAAPKDASTKKDSTLPAPVIAVPFKKLPSFKKGGYRAIRIIYIYYCNYKNIVSWLPAI